VAGNPRFGRRDHELGQAFSKLQGPVLVLLTGDLGRKETLLRHRFGLAPRTKTTSPAIFTLVTCRQVASLHADFTGLEFSDF